MFGKKFLSVFVALVLVGQVSVFAQDSAVGSSGTREIPVSGSELQRHTAGQGHPKPRPSQTVGGTKPVAPSELTWVNKNVDVAPDPLIPSVLFMGLIFWLGMKFAQYRARPNQQTLLK